jgi:nitrite reductase/ring-hydroxylating ferredoxin subunit
VIEDIAEPRSSKKFLATHDGLVRQLKSAGYRICTFSVSSTGSYSVEDADWNYKDVPHLNVVHTQVRAIIGTMEDDVITTINLQKVLGIPFPVSVVNYAVSPMAQTYFTTLGPYILVVHTKYESIGDNETRVSTTYNIAGSPLVSFAFPLLRRILRSNYKTLMSEDLPMRDRRGSLRARGFRFKSDGRSRTFAETTDLLFENVVPPARPGTHTESVGLEQLAAEGASMLVGPDDDRGVRLVRKGDEVLVMPRVCGHEGASLDCAAIANDSLVCPWHAKRVATLFRIPLRDGSSADARGTSARIADGKLTLTLPA